MTTTITGTNQSVATASASTATAAASAASQPLGQDAFLKLLMAQLSNQDPLNPTDDTTFVTQLAQFSLVEQSQSQTTQLGTISTQLQGLSNSSATALVGRTVTVDGGSLAFDGSDATTANVTLSGPAQSVTATISDSSGNVVQTLTLGPQAAGPVAITWNGSTAAGQTEPAGTYSVAVSATAANGASVGVSQNVTGVVSSVSFAQGYPQLTLANGTVAPLSQLGSVGATPTTP